MTSRRPTPTRRPAALVIAALLLATALVTSAGPASAGADGWWWPIEPPEVVEVFDPPEGPYGPGHRGVDLAGRFEQPVHAAADGVVTFAGRVGGIGMVTIDHGDLSTTYQPLLSWIVIGTTVELGQLVGTLHLVGSHCTNPCLHWGVRTDAGTYVDPLSLLDPGPSRLLPYWGSSGSRMSQPGTVRDPASVSGSGTPPAVPAVGPAAAAVARATDGQGSAAMSGAGEPPSNGVAAGVAVVVGLAAGAAAVMVLRRRR